MYALFAHPEMFDRYVAASPAYAWDNSVLYQFESKYYENKSNRPAKLFMCAGEVETNVPGFEKLTKYLRDRHYPSLQMESKILENTGHSGTKGEGFARGLQFVFKRASLQLPLTVLDQYNGTYNLDDGTTVNVKTEDGALAAYVGNAKYILQAASETDFYLVSFFLKIQFKKDEKGKVSGFQLEQYGSSEFAGKIK